MTTYCISGRSEVAKPEFTESEVGYKIVTKKRFSAEVEDLFHTSELGYIDSIVVICERRMIEPEHCKRLLSRSIVDKLEKEAMLLNIIPKANELPFQ